MMIPVPVLAIGAAIGPLIGWRAARSRGRAEMRRELTHWQEAAARATAEAARVARKAEAFQAGCNRGREDVISIMPLLVAAQQSPADEERASGDQR